MKIYIEGSADEIARFLYGGDEGEGEPVCDECKGGNIITPCEKLKLDLAKAIAEAVDGIIAKDYPL